MKLFLASRAVHPTSIKKLDEYVGGLAGKSVAYIPTAANGDGYGLWKTKNEGSWVEIQKLGLDISLVQLEDFRDESAVEALKGKDIIWVAGGECGYLMYWMRRCQIDKHIHSLLSDKTVYVGSSAGSMICAPTLELTEWYGKDMEPGASIIPGLGLVDFDFYPHFEDDQMKYIKAHNRSKKLYVMKDGESLIVEDNKITVFGNERLITSTI